MKKKRKIIKSFFGLIYCAVMSIPLVYLAINSYREYHRVNAYDNQTSALLNSDNNDYYNDYYLEKYTLVNSNTMYVANNYYQAVYNSNNTSLSSATFLVTDSDLSKFLPSTETRIIVGFTIIQENYARLNVNFSNGETYRCDRWNDIDNTFYFTLKTSPSYATGSFRYTDIYLLTYVVANDVVDVPSSANNIPVNYNTIVNDTITDLSFANDYLISFNIFELLGLDYSDVAWANFVNYYCQYIITLSVCLFFVEIILCFIQWCRDLVYTFTDKQEGGF